MVDHQADVAVHQDPVDTFVDTHNCVGEDRVVPRGEHRPRIRPVGLVVESQTETRLGESQRPKLIDLTTQAL